MLGVERGIAEANRGSDLKIARLLRADHPYVCPAYLLAILVGFAYQNFADKARAVIERPAALMTATFMLVVFAFLWLLTSLAARRWNRERRFEKGALGRRSPQ